MVYIVDGLQLVSNVCVTFSSKQRFIYMTPFYVQIVPDEKVIDWSHASNPKYVHFHDDDDDDDDNHPAIPHLSFCFLIPVEKVFKTGMPLSRKTNSLTLNQQLVFWRLDTFLGKRNSFRRSTHIEQCIVSKCTNLPTLDMLVSKWLKMTKVLGQIDSCPYFFRFRGSKHFRALWLHSFVAAACRIVLHGNGHTGRWFMSGILDWMQLPS